MEGKGFNPCSGGSIALGDVRPQRSADSPGVSILVLVEVLPWDFSQEGPGLSARRFNPCSGGSIALGLLVFPGRFVGFPFQSLFWWKYCPGLVGTLTAKEWKEFQSLFWWKYCPGKNAFKFPHQIAGPFQSLFWWKYCPGSILCISFEIATVYTNRLRLKISI